MTERSLESLPAYVEMEQARDICTDPAELAHEARQAPRAAVRAIADILTRLELHIPDDEREELIKIGGALLNAHDLLNPEG
jgi:hypothetical protein